MERQFYVYVMASNSLVLYVGVTGDLVKRAYEHKTNVVKGFTSRYAVHKLVYLEAFGDAYYAITREKQIKRWKIEWKLELIQKTNPNFRDLYSEIV